MAEEEMEFEPYTDRSQDNFADGSSRDPKENPDLAWDMAHAEKPMQDTALEAKLMAQQSLDAAANGMSDDLTDVSSNMSGATLEQAREDRVKGAQAEQEYQLRQSNEFLEKVKTLRAQAERASERQVKIYELLKQLESELEKV